MKTKYSKLKGFLLAEEYSIISNRFVQLFVNLPI